MSRGFFFICITLLVFGNASAGPNAVHYPVTPESGWQFGMEVEVSGQHGLKNLMSYFDITPPDISSESEFRNAADDLPSERKIIDLLSATDVDDYLTPNTIESLPKSVRDILLDGKDLEVKIPIVQRAFETPPEAKVPPLKNTTLVIVPPAPNTAPAPRSAGGLILPEGYNVAEGHREIVGSSGLIVRDGAESGQDWNRVAERWKKMDFARKKELIEINNLSPLIKATLMQAGAIPPAWLTVKSSVSGPTKDLLSRLRWYREGGQLEFNHRVPVKSQEAFLKDVYLFSDLIGIRKYLDDPTLPQVSSNEFSYHMHVSRYGDDLSEVADRLNRLRLLQLTNSGRGAAGHQLRHGHRSDVKKKGLVRLVDLNHFESRTRVASPKAELEHLVGVMSVTKAEAIPKLEAEILREENKLIRTISETAHRAQLTTSSAARKALEEKLTTGFETLGRVADKGWAQRLMDQLVADGTQAETKVAISQIVKLNNSVHGSNFILPVAAIDDVNANFDRIARSYIEPGHGSFFVDVFRTQGYTDAELAKRLEKPFQEFLESEVPDKFGKATIFVENLPPTMQQTFWEAAAKRAKSPVDIYTLVKIWKAPADSATIMDAAQRAAKLIDQAASDVSDGFPAYLRTVQNVRARLKSLSLIAALARAVLKRVKLEEGFSLTNVNAAWIVPFAEKSDIDMLRKALKEETPAIHHVLKRLIELGEPIDVPLVDKFLREGFVSNVREVIPAFNKVIAEGSSAEKQKLVKLAGEGAFKQIPFTSYASNANERNLYLSLVNGMIGSEAPSPQEAEFVQTGLKALYRQDAAGKLSDRTVKTVIEKSKESPLNSEWRALILDHWKSTGFYYTDLAETSSSWPREWFEFLEAEMKRGEPNGQKAAAVFDQILIGEKNRKLLENAGDKVLKRLFTARKAYPPKKFLSYQIGRIARAGTTAVDFALEQIGAGVDDIRPIAEDVEGAKALRQRLLERQLTQDRNGKKSVLYQALSGAKMSPRLYRTRAKLYAADVANLAPSDAVLTCPQRFGRLGH